MFIYVYMCVLLLHYFSFSLSLLLKLHPLFIPIFLILFSPCSLSGIVMLYDTNPTATEDVTKGKEEGREGGRETVEI